MDQNEKGWKRGSKLELDKMSAEEQNILMQLSNVAVTY